MTMYIYIGMYGSTSISIIYNQQCCSFAPRGDTAAMPGRAANLVEDPAGKLSFKRKDSKFQCIGFLHAMICYAFKV
jgi:hypothetical protein